MRKRLLIFLCLLIGSIAVEAQHFSFMGIPLNGSETNFINKLVQKGFKPTTFRGDKLWAGNFYGKPVYVGCLSSNYTGTVIGAQVVYKAVYNSDKRYDIMYKVASELAARYKTEATFMTKGEEEGWGMKIYKGNKQIGGITVEWLIIDGQHGSPIIAYMDTENTNLLRRQAAAAAYGY